MASPLLEHGGITATILANEDPAGYGFKLVRIEPSIGMPLEERLSILKELMRAMNLVTVAGREHVMNKMLVILRRETLRLSSPLVEADLATMSHAMTELEHEAGRYAPTPGAFNRHVEVVIGALRRTTIVPGAMVRGAEPVLPFSIGVAPGGNSGPRR